VIIKIEELVECKLSKSKIKKIICGSNHTFVLTKDGICFCFGINYEGQLGLKKSVPIKKIKCK